MMPEIDTPSFLLLSWTLIGYLLGSIPFGLLLSRRLGLAAGRLATGAPADLVLFDPGKPFILDRLALRSKSKNTPFDGARLQGRVSATYVAGTCVYEAE